MTTARNDDIPEGVSSLFSHVMNLKPMIRDQAAKAWKTYFGTEAPVDSRATDGLALADFEEARRHLLLRGGDFSSRERITNELQRQHKINAVDYDGPGIETP